MELCKRVWALHKLARAYPVPPEMICFDRSEPVVAKYCRSYMLADDDDESGVVTDDQVCGGFNHP